MTSFNAIDALVHSKLVRGIIDFGYAPTAEEIARELQVSPENVVGAFKSLSENHGLVLHPNSHDVWVVHPFSLSPTAVWVGTSTRGWWAPCMWCGFGIAFLVGNNVEITTRIGGEHEEIKIHVTDGIVKESDLYVHFSIPPADAWQNVFHFCATVLPFRSPNEVDRWSARHRLQKGALVPIEKVNRLAHSWYGQHANEDWQKWSISEARNIFESSGLTESFWSLPESHGKF